MTATAATFLQRHHVFRSRDAEETRAFLDGNGFRFELSPRRSQSLNVQINAISMPSMCISYTHYGDLPIELSLLGARGEYWIQLPVRGTLAANIAGESVDCDRSRAAIASPMHEDCRFLSNPNSSRVQLTLTKSAVTAQLGVLLGEPADTAIDFAPAIDLTAGYGRCLAQYILMAAADLDHTDSTLLNPITRSAFEQFILTGLLLSHPHNYTLALRRRERPVAPRDVKRAIDYLKANLDAPLTLADLVVASGVPGRTLFKHFRDSHGVSPIRYLRNARFQKVREALLCADADQSITTIAMRWGFAHLGRFSGEYRARFGETPSQTLRRHRQ